MHEGRRGPVRQRCAGLVQRCGEHGALGQAAEITVLLVVRSQVQQRNRAIPERCERRADQAVAADLGQRRGDLGQADTVTARPFGHRQRRHTTGDKRFPGVVPVEYRGDHIGDSLLLRVWREIHQLVTTLLPE